MDQYYKIDGVLANCFSFMPIKPCPCTKTDSIPRTSLLFPFPQLKKKKKKLKKQNCMIYIHIIFSFNYVYLQREIKNLASISTALFIYLFLYKHLHLSILYYYLSQYIGTAPFLLERWVCRKYGVLAGCRVNWWMEQNNFWLWFETFCPSLNGMVIVFNRLLHELCLVEKWRFSSSSSLFFGFWREMIVVC